MIRCLTPTHLLFTANLTGHTEKVGMENFELLKVLGTGGETSKHNLCHNLPLSLNYCGSSVLALCHRS